jgi:ArsR family transcriptional regulator, arsenate/arsenite/antimonite-responsive transcriptional repressor
MMAEVNFKDVERLFKAVSNKRRLQIVAFLKKEKEVTVGIIAEEIKLSFKSTSRHLGVLFSAGIVDKDQRGLEVYYSLSPAQHSIIKHTLSIL